MRSLSAMAACALLALPLISVSPARADNDFFDKAQKFFNNDNDHDAYERGRRDQMRQQQAERDRWRREHERDWSRDHRDGDSYGYNYH